MSKHFHKIMLTSVNYFIVSFQKAMTVKEVKKTEDIVNEVIAKDQEVYAKVTPLADAKAIQGLRAIFDEVSARWK